MVQLVTVETGVLHDDEPVVIPLTGVEVAVAQVPHEDVEVAATLLPFPFPFPFP